MFKKLMHCAVYCNHTVQNVFALIGIIRTRRNVKKNFFYGLLPQTILRSKFKILKVKLHIIILFSLRLDVATSS